MEREGREVKGNHPSETETVVICQIAAWIARVVLRIPRR
jgi:hypothetical protein